jgi:hypothetical protein
MKTIAVLAFATCVFACKQPQPEPLPLDKPAPPSSAPTISSASTSGTTGDPHGAAIGDPHGAAIGDPHGAATGGGAATPADAEEIGYDAPASWTSAPNPTPMRKATFKIPKAGSDTEDAELAVSAASGGVEPNVKRWEQQFGDAKAKTEARTVNGLKVTIVEIKGKFASGGMMGQPQAPKSNQMLLGAIVDTGDRQHFFKMTGGEKTVTAARKDFDKLVSTLRAK